MLLSIQGVLSQINSSNHLAYDSLSSFMESKKTIVIINQTAGSPYHGMVYRNYYLAREWVRLGHRAIIISSSSFHNFHTQPKCEGLFTQEYIDGVEYWWVKMPSYSQSRSFGRLFSIFLFPLLLLLFPFRKIPKPDTIIVSGPPHTPIINAWLWSRITSATLVYEVRDIWPLTIQKLGGVSSWHPLIMILSFFERVAYLLSDRVVSVLALANRHFETKGMLPAKFSFIPNGIDLTGYSIKDNDVGREIAKISEKKFTLIYAGSFGIANHLDMLMNVAESLKDKDDVAFVLLGEGPHKNNLIDQAKDNKNVYFFPYVPKEQIPYILRQAHIGFIGFVKTDLYKFGVSPNKIFDYMAAELPILMVLDSEDDIIEKANAGITVRSGENKDIKEALLALKNLPKEELRQLGKNGRSYLEFNHVYSALSEKYLNVVEEGRRPVEESARWAISPFWLGFTFIFIFGLVAHFILPEIFPHLFRNGITTFLTDPHNFHSIAVEYANKPWSEFTFRPLGQFPSGILALIYKVTGIHKPFMMLPILSILAGLTIRGIASCLDVLGVRGRWWPIIIGFLFTVTPTSISWMIYPHKDAFIVPGVVLITWTFMTVTLRRIRLRHFFAMILGSILVFSNKTYFAELFFAGTLLALPFAWKQPATKMGKFGRMVFFALGLSLFLGVFLSKKSYLDDGDSAPAIDTQTKPLSVDKTQTVSDKPRHIDTKENWQSLPGGKLVNKPLLALAYTRERFLHERSYGSTNFMPEIHLMGAWDTICFIPRALQLAVLEPLPWRMPNDDEGILRRILFISVQLEMILVYFSIFFLLTSGKRSWKTAVLISLALAIPFLLALGFAAPNIGTINRYRFPFLLLIKIAGFSALWNSSRFKWPGRLLMWVDPPEIPRKKKKVLFLVPDDVTFIIQRLVMAQGVLNAGYDVHVASEDTGVSDKVRELGFTFHHLDLNRGGLNPFADFKPFVKLVFFLAKERPDILQCVSIKPVLYGATAGTIVGLNKIVCLVNGMGYAFEGHGAKGKVIKTIAIALYRNALALPGIRVIFQNPDDRAYFVDHHLVDAHKTLLIRGSGVNMEKFKPSPQPENPQPVILFVGRLLWNKGIKELVEAARILKNENLKFTLKIVGGPDDRNPEAVPKAFLEELHEQGIIDWVGRQTDMPKFYRESDIICLPTQYKEGLPLTLLEAASTGRALVATDVPGCREIVRDGINGYLVPPKSVNELADALRKLITDADLRKIYGEKSSEIVRTEFASPIIQSQLVGVYESLLNDSAPSGNNLVHA